MRPSTRAIGFSRTRCWDRCTPGGRARRPCGHGSTPAPAGSSSSPSSTPPTPSPRPTRATTSSCPRSHHGDRTSAPDGRAPSPLEKENGIMQRTLIGALALLLAAGTAPALQRAGVTFVAAIQDDATLGSASAVAVSPDGAHVYAAAPGSRSHALVAFA